MKATGHIYTIKHQGAVYYYRPSVETWVKDMTKISLGDIYFDNILVRAKLGSPAVPGPIDGYDGDFEKKTLKFELA